MWCRWGPDSLDWMKLGKCLTSVTFQQRLSWCTVSLLRHVLNSCTCAKKKYDLISATLATLCSRLLKITTLLDILVDLKTKHDMTTVVIWLATHFLPSDATVWWEIKISYAGYQATSNTLGGWGGGGVWGCNFSIWSHPRAKSQCFHPHADKEECLECKTTWGLFLILWMSGSNAGQMSPHGARPWTLPPIYLSRTVHKRLIQCVGAETLADVGVSCLCRDVAENQLTLDPSYFLGWCHLKMDSVRLWND